MSAYYNEIDPMAAEWLRELIRRDLIAGGEVDERNIVDVQPDDLRGFAQCHFFAGVGTWSYALRQAGWPDNAPVWTGSCPCQPFSSAGKGKGFADERHLWPAFHHLIRFCRPNTVFGEQVASKDGLAWLDLVYADLEGEGYAVGAVDTCSAGFGAPNIRQRLYWAAGRLADPLGQRHHRGGATGPEAVPQVGRVDAERRADPIIARHPGPTNGYWGNADWLRCRDGHWRPVEPGTFPLADGAAARMVRLRGYGNAINVAAAKEFVKAFMSSSLFPCA